MASPAGWALRDRFRSSSTLSYRPPVMAEKIRAVSAPRAGENRVCRTVLAWVRASMARAMASYSAWRASSRRVHWSRWACKLSGLSMVRSWPVRLSTRERASRS